jgi:hypothetical protein
VADPVHDDDFDAEAAKDGGIEQDIREIFVGDDAAVERDHKDLILETRNVFQNAAEVGWFYVGAIAHRGVAL